MSQVAQCTADNKIKAGVMWSHSHELSSGENRQLLRCTVPEIFGSEHREQTCEQCEQRASRQRVSVYWRVRKSCCWSSKRPITCEFC